MATSSIIDPRTGEPFETDVFDTVQTDEARISGLHQRYDAHPSSGLTPYKLAQIMTNAEQHQLVEQAELAADMEEKDGHLFAEIQKRKLALTTVGWQIKPPRNATKAEIYATEWLAERLDHLDMSEVIMDMADAILKGYSAQTIEWSMVEGSHIPINLDWIPQSWFTTAQADHNKLQLIGLDGAGQDLWPGGWVVHHHKAKSGYLGRAGLVRTLAWPYLFKNYALRDLAEFLEIYGLPLRLGKYPSGATDKEKAKLLQAVVEIGHNAAGIIPDSMALEFKEAAKGQAEPFLALMNWAERTTSKAILGGTLTSGTDGGGAYALGEVHNEVRYDIRDADLRQIAGTLTRDLLWPMVAFNLSGVPNYYRCPRFEFATEQPEDIKLLSESIPKLQNMGMSISKKWLHKQTQIPEPEDADDLLAPMQPMSLVGLNQKTAALSFVPQQPELPSPAQQIATAANEQISLADWMERIEAMLESAQSFEEFKDMLFNGFNDLPIEVMQQPLMQALISANLAGRADTEDESHGG